MVSNNKNESSKTSVWTEAWFLRKFGYAILSVLGVIAIATGIATAEQVDLFVQQSGTLVTLIMSIGLGIASSKANRVSDLPSDAPERLKDVDTIKADVEVAKKKLEEAKKKLEEAKKTSSKLDDILARMELASAQRVVTGGSTSTLDDDRERMSR